MSTCTATKRDGSPCTLPARGQQPFCWAHSPETAEKRKRIASRGGRDKAAKRVAVLWDEVREVIANVKTGGLEPQQGNTMLRGFNTLIALDRLDVERSELAIQQRRLELDEQERLELLPRMEALEDAITANREARKWHA